MFGPSTTTTVCPAVVQQQTTTTTTEQLQRRNDRDIGTSSDSQVRKTSNGGTAGKDYLQFFTDWRDALYATLDEKLPRTDFGQVLDTFCKSCQSVQSANQVAKDAQDLVNSIQKRTPVDTDELKIAQTALEHAQQAVNDALSTCRGLAGDVLDGHRSSSIYDSLTETVDADLVTYTVLQQATPEYLAEYCQEDASTDEEMTQRLLTTLADTELLRLFLESGGARHGKYGAAIEVYQQLLQHQKTNSMQSPVLKKLALACALVLADPYPLFDGTGVTDAVARYVHYEQAYLLGELDPNFGIFTVWEIRHVVNSDATEDQLRWGRQCLRTYRPDILTWPDSQWTYCRIVRTDVPYNDPVWYKEHHTYDQILSGGGKCGPRAWYGRFICKAFGIPTWGVKQPGHAAMTRWTPDRGWMVCLGSSFFWSWWEDQGGLDFELETKARAACTDREYEQKILRLEWLAGFYKENSHVVRQEGSPDPKSPFWSLSMMERQRMAISAQLSKSHKLCEDVPHNEIRLLQASKAIHVTDTFDYSTGTITIPAASCSSPTKPTNKVMFLKCFLGGQQLFVSDDGEVDYKLDKYNIKEERSYKLICRVSTVHRGEEAILLTVGSSPSDSMESIHSIKMPYTMGLWQDTEPIIVELGGQNSTLHFARTSQKFGYSFHSIRLEPDD